MSLHALVLFHVEKSAFSFALCGFANISSMAMLIGGLGSLVPEKRAFVSKHGFRAIIAGVMANLMSASIAGVILSQ